MWIKRIIEKIKEKLTIPDFLPIIVKHSKILFQF